MRSLDRPAGRSLDSQSSDAVGFYRLIISEGVRFPELTRTFCRIGLDRTIAHLAGMLSLWCERGLIRLDDPQLAAVQFFDWVSADLHRRAIWNGIRADGRPA
jgi:hypothetical protein